MHLGSGKRKSEKFSVLMIPWVKSMDTEIEKHVLSLYACHVFANGAARQL